MLNSSMTYPYPILRNKPTDYKTGIFEVQINKVNQKNGFNISVTYGVNNDQIKELLEKRIIAYAIQIQCVSTWYRKLEISDTEKQTIFLPSNLVHERVDMCPCIIALEDIKDFHINDFTDDFEEIPFSVNKGEVIAIGERQKFDALYKDDIIKKSESIVSFINDTECSVMYCEWEFEAIQIHLPKKQYELYTHIGEYESWKIPVLNAIYVVPVISQAINEIYNDEFQNGQCNLEKYAWYKTLKFMIKKVARDDAKSYKKMLSDPIKTTQLLLNDNSAQALDIISKVVKQ